MVQILYLAYFEFSMLFSCFLPLQRWLVFFLFSDVQDLSFEVSFPLFDPDHLFPPGGPPITHRTLAPGTIKSSIIHDQSSTSAGRNEF